MSGEDIDCARIERIIRACIGRHENIHAARLAGVFLIPARDRAVELALPYGMRLASSTFRRIPDGSRIELRDLEQAASIGIINGIDRFKPAAGNQVTTVLHTWVDKHLKIEIEENHWRTAKPSKADRRRYFGRDGMSDDERRDYETAFMAPVRADFDGAWNGVELTGTQI